MVLSLRVLGAPCGSRYRMAWSETDGFQAFLTPWAPSCRKGHATMSICDSLSASTLVGPSQRQTLDPVRESRSERAAASSVSPSLGLSIWMLTSPPPSKWGYRPTSRWLVGWSRWSRLFWKGGGAPRPAGRCCHLA
eukprot:6748597-Pyramimonas_sp.AAC.1